MTGLDDLTGETRTRRLSGSNNDSTSGSATTSSRRVSATGDPPSHSHHIYTPSFKTGSIDLQATGDVIFVVVVVVVDSADLNVSSTPLK